MEEWVKGNNKDVDKASAHLVELQEDQDKIENHWNEKWVLRGTRGIKCSEDIPNKLSEDGMTL